MVLVMWKGEEEKGTGTDSIKMEWSVELLILGSKYTITFCSGDIAKLVSCDSLEN